MQRILIIMESESMGVALEAALGESFSLTRCGESDSGAELLSHKYDGLVIDLYLPGMTGLAFLEKNQSQLPPVVLMLSPLITPYVLQTAQQLGVGFLIRLPCTMAEISSHLWKMLLPPEPSETIRAHLLRLRLSPRLLGFSYLTECIRLFAADTHQRVSKDLYPTIARKYRTSPDAVEYAIRACIRDGWVRRDPDVWGRYFPGCVHCPSNREFIAVLSEFA